MENLTRVAVSLEDIDIEIEGSESFVKAEWEKLRDQLFIYLQSKIGEHLPATPVNKLAEFYQQKKPRGHLKTVTVFGYYLKHFEGKEEFSQADLRRCYDQLGLAPPKVLAQSIRDVRSRYKFFDKGSKRGYYKISSLGEKFVETELPK
ncbi:MAG: hypothetical protein J7M03_03060 [Candidatus Desulfofervidaceae bacterium]|nr:hypothetical protein [Candidatus Desulfofervidaceae bacterium]